MSTSEQDHNNKNFSDSNGDKTIAFIGLGVMGFPMAGHLAKAGHCIQVYNRTSARALLWMKEYAAYEAKCCVKDSAKSAAQNADIIFICVGNDDDLREIVLSESGVFAGAKKGSIICDHTTSSAKLARELYEKAKDKGLCFVDAPVSGGQAGAENGALTIMLGGDDEAYQALSSYIDCYSKRHSLLGPSGNGQLAKMANQICISGVLQGLSEALRFGEKAGLDMPELIDVISQGAAQSWQMDNRAKTMVKREFDFGFAVDWMRKDLRYAIDEAEGFGLPLDLSKAVLSAYDELSRQGGGRFDTSSLINFDQINSLNVKEDSGL